MKYVLDEKDRKRPWYKGMVNMDDGELDEYMKNQLKCLLQIAILLVGMAAIYIILLAISDSWTDSEKENGIGIIIGFFSGILIAEVCVIPSLMRRIRLVKEERECAEN